MIKSILLSSLLMIVTQASDSSYVLTPSGRDGEQVGVVIIQGAQCPPSGYEHLAREIQSSLNDNSMNAWIGVPEYIADVPEPLQFGSKFEEIVSKMKDKGMNETTKIVVAAHSLGAVMSQSWVHDHASDHNVVAQVLFGATVLRKYRDKSYPVPTLTVDGTLDGLLHITRQAEAYFHQVEGKSVATIDRPVVILEGLNHWSFSSGTPPGNVKKNDLKAEVSEEDGHVEIANIVANYIMSKVSSDDALVSKGSSFVQLAVEKTGEILDPVLSALKMSGYHYLNGWCDSDYPTNPTCQYPKWPDKSIGPAKGPPSPTPSTDCTCGSPWVANVAQNMMGGLDLANLEADVKISNKDAFHDVSDVRPFHLPHIFSPKPGTACDTSSSKCTIETTTVTMPVYDSKDTLLDTGLYPVTASEYRTKLKSRQAIWESAGLTNVSFSDTDKNNVSICKSINEQAYEWALSQASDVARERFDKLGQPYRFVNDVYSGIGITGPTWIHNALSFKTSDDKKYVDVSAPYFATENKNLGDEPYTSTVGYHYCKLLSPARAMEWIYVDGLREFGSI